ncbi:MAG: glycosyltransferase family 2 protein [Burkholderiales bacterium]
MMRPTHLRAGLRVLKRHLRYAGGNPKKLYWVIRRALAMARDGSLGGVLERHAADGALMADYSAWCARYEEAAAALAHERSVALGRRPLVSILLPVHDVPAQHLKSALESVLAQRYGEWELCVIDDASTLPEVAAVLTGYAARDSRIRVSRRAVNGGIAQATNDALAMARGELCAFLDHDDAIAPDALECMVVAAEDSPEVVYFFSDEDRLDAAGQRTRPFFKPAWDGEWIRTTNCVLHFVVMRTRFLRELGGINTGVDGAQDWDLALRVEEVAGRERILHVPRVLYHWREIPGSTAAAVFEKPALIEAQRKVIADSLARRAERAEVSLCTTGWRLQFALPEPAPLVSIVIPTRDHARLLRACLASISQRTTYIQREIVLIDNESREPEAVELLAELARSGAARIVSYPHAFNYAAQCNIGVREARGSVIALLNNDIEVVTPGWLEELVSRAMRPATGLVGATLYYPDGTLQHAGVVLGLNGVGDRPWIGTQRGFAGPYGRTAAVREVSALITACAAVARDRYLEVGGMDESLPVSCNDLDLCLRLRRAGYRNVISPWAELVHHESASRGYEDDPTSAAAARDEEAWFARSWSQAIAEDPCYNPNLALRGSAYALAWPPRIPGVA